VQLNWEHELSTWLVGDVDCLIVDSKNADKIPQHDGPIIVTYDLAAKPHLVEHLLAETWDIAISDEAQAFNSHSSQRTGGSDLIKSAAEKCYNVAARRDWPHGHRHHGAAVIATSDDKPMNAQQDYVIRMTKAELPPAIDFWSVTLLKQVAEI
jgi:hypothetical protein